MKRIQWFTNQDSEFQTSRMIFEKMRNSGDLYLLLLFVFVVVGITSCDKLGIEDNYDNLKIDNDSDTISVNIDGIAVFDLVKTKLAQYNGDNQINKEEHLFLNVGNLSSDTIETFNFWIIGYESSDKTNSEINFVYKKNIIKLPNSLNLGEINTTYNNIGGLSEEYFDIEISNYGASNSNFAGLYSASLSFFKNDSIEIAAATGLCQINYLGDFMLKLIDDSIVSKISGTLSAEGNFFGKIQGSSGEPNIVSDTVFQKVGDDIEAKLLLQGSLPDSTITHIKLNLSSY